MVFDRLGHPYFPLRDRGHLEIDIGISHFQPRVRNRKKCFSNEEIMAARRCLTEIAESLEYTHSLIAEHGAGHPVQEDLRLAKARCASASSHERLSPASAIALA
jgi:hypothetical protein